MLSALLIHGLKTMSLIKIKLSFSNCEGIYYERKTNKRGGGVLMYIRKDLTYKIRNDSCISDGYTEILTIELLTKSMRNIIVSCCYKALDGNWENHCDYLQEILTDVIMESKRYFVTENFNLNCLEFQQKSEIKQFFSNMFEKFL